VITKILALKNIGPFKDWEWPHESDPGAPPPFGPVTLIAGDNGKGKTTVAAVLRSLEDNDPNAVLERRRGTAKDRYHDFLAKVEHDGGKVCLSNESGWNGQRPSLFVFDDTFVSRNIYEGLVVGAKQREALHELVVGEAGVQEARNAEALRSDLSKLKKEQKELANTLSVELRYLTLERVLRERPPEDIDVRLAALEQDMKRAVQIAPIRALPEFDALPQVPELPLDDVRALLETPVEQIEDTAQALVLAHLKDLGDGGALWIHDGLARLGGNADARCPFCDQRLGDTARSLILAYRAHFNNEYQALQARCSQATERIRRSIPEAAGEALTAAKKRLVEAHRQWSVHLPDLPEIPELSGIDALAVARRGLLHGLETKRTSPLSMPTVNEETMQAADTWRGVLARCRQIESALTDLRERTGHFKAQVGDLDESRLGQQQQELLEWKRVREERYQGRLIAYRKAENAIQERESDLVRAKEALAKYQEDQFPRFRDSINTYLERFGATFRLREMKKTPSVGGERRVDYVLEAADTLVNVSATPKPGFPHFGSLLSAGDRRTLAFAFFLTILATKELDGTTVVCDDPATSLDLDRQTRTLEELLGLAQRGAQLVVLSHYEPFLRNIAARVARLASGRSPLGLVSLRIVGTGHDSRLAAHELDTRPPLVRHRDDIRGYIEGRRAVDPRGIANQCRKLLEGILQTCFPDQYVAGGCLKEFFGRAQPLIDAGRLDQATCRELKELRDFFNPESHFQERSAPTDTEMQAYAGRLLKLAELRLGEA
jgi:wobble nucleotide-excising tRNase